MPLDSTAVFPMLLPWVDLTPLRGQTVFTGTSIPSSAGIYRSLLHCQNNLTAISSVSSVTASFDYGLDGLVMHSYRQSVSSYPYLSLRTMPAWGGRGNNPAWPEYHAQDMMWGSLRPFVVSDPPPTNLTASVGIRKYTASNTYTDTTLSYPSPGYWTIRPEEIGPVLLEQTGLVIQDTNQSSFYSWWQTSNPLLGRTVSDITTIDPSLLPILRAKGTKGCECRIMHLVGYQPSRPLASPPVMIERCTSVDHVTIGGRTYHMQHSRRTTWQVELLLDGAIDSRLQNNLFVSGGTAMGVLDPISTWDTFLEWAEAGVSLWVDRALGPGKFIRPANSVMFPGIPNLISGQLVDASQMRLAYDDGLTRRYKVTLTIAEEDPY